MNAANRTYDSNGPDVKVRGTAAHIYDKYQALARDASSSGDRIAAENYLQHAEHYFRLMAAAAAAQQQQNGQPGQPGQQPRANGQGVPHMSGLDGDDIDGYDTSPSEANGNGSNGQRMGRTEAQADDGDDAGDADADADGDEQPEEVTA